MSTSVSPLLDPPTLFPNTVEAYDANSGSQRNRLYWRLCTGSESGAFTLSLQSAQSTRHSAVLMVFRGLNTTTPIDAFSRFDETVAGLTHNAPAVTLVTANCGILVLEAERASDGTTAITPPTGFTSNQFDTDTQAMGAGGTFTAAATDNLATVRSAGT